MPAIPFAGESYADRSPNANCQRSVNLYPMASPTPDNPQRIVMYPTPGFGYLKAVAARADGPGMPIRGILSINMLTYIVCGDEFLSWDGRNTFTVLGTLSTNAGRCSLATNTVQLAVSDGSFGYVYNLGTGLFTRIGGGAWPAGGVTNLTFQDDYILAAVNGSRQVIQSALLDATTWPAQAFTDVTSFPDDIVAVYSDQIQLYVFGPKLTEVRFDAGDIPFAFEKVQGVLIQAGCASAATIQKVGNSLVWLAQDAAGKAYVAVLDGYATQVLSNAALNEAIERYPTVADAFAYTYREADNQFYVITFPSAEGGAGATWAIDAKTRRHHERSIDGGSDLPTHYVTLDDGTHVVGDASGKLYEMSQDYSTDGSGNGLRRIRACQHLGGEATLFVDELHVDIESGVGLVGGQGLDPLATLEISRDGGHTWLNVGVANMGKMGQYQTRLTWRRLGRFRNGATFRLTITDPVRTYIIGAYAKVRQGNK